MPQFGENELNRAIQNDDPYLKAHWLNIWLLYCNGLYEMAIAFSRQYQKHVIYFQTLIVLESTDLNIYYK